MSLNKRLIRTNDTGGGGIVTCNDPFGDSSLKTLYQMNGNANDSLNNDDGSPVGVSWVSGLYNQAVRFDGIDDYINSVQRLNVGDTITGWIKPDFTAGANRFFRIYGSYDSQYDFSVMYLFYSNTTGEWKLQLRIRNEVGRYLYQDAVVNNVNTNDWNFFTISFASYTQYECSLNGVIYTPTTTASGSNPTSIAVGARYIGRHIINGATTYTDPCDIDQVRYFNRTLNQDEINILNTLDAPCG